MSLPENTQHTQIIRRTLWLLISYILTVSMFFLFVDHLITALLAGLIIVPVEYILYLIFLVRKHNADTERQKHFPVVVWFTGLSGAGKTTLAQTVMEEFKKQNLPVEFLDGDALRYIFPKTGFSREERERHIRRVGFLAGLLEKNGISVVASFISPYQDSREFVKEHCRNYVEVYVSTPLAECEQRDAKGLYAKARAGDIQHFTGLDDPYEVPSNPGITIDTSSRSVDDCVREIMEKIHKVMNSEEEKER